MTDFLQIFYRDGGHGLSSFWRDQNGIWSNQFGPAQQLKGKLNGAPAACQIPGTGVAQVFYRGTDNSVYSQWRNTDGS